MTNIKKTIFVENELINIFHRTMFLKKTIFFKTTVKNNFWGDMTIFEVKWASDNKNEKNLFCVKWGYQTLFLSLFFKKAHTGGMKAKKLVLGAHFSYIGGCIGPFVSKNNRVQPW